ncbi:MAG: hypothetical protein ABR968_12840 [Bacteroidales bacterium]|jgi:uncharacterized membrane protein
MKRGKSTFIVIFSIVFTIVIAWFQRVTGPTYPYTGKLSINNNEIKFKLPRTSDSKEGEQIRIKIADNSVKGKFIYKLYKSNDSLRTVDMTRDGDYLVTTIPPLPPAGKIMYKIKVESGNQKADLSDDWTIIRYKGVVPASILILHIIIMFIAMLFSTLTGMEALFKGIRTYRYCFVTVVTLFIGGIILGPIVQKYAFGAYWTGWPFGHDFTDNKTVVAFIFWIIAFFKLARNKLDRKWAIIAAIMLLAVYLVPHSVLGSEIDYTQVH